MSVNRRGIAGFNQISMPVVNLIVTRIVTAAHLAETPAVPSAHGHTYADTGPGHPGPRSYGKPRRHTHKLVVAERHTV
jgi:hypothetical protein